MKSLGLLVVGLVLGGCGAASEPPEDASSALGQGCVPRANDGSPARANADPLTKVLGQQGQCPRDVLEFRSLLTASGASLETSFVNNRGFHAPNDGSFSFFESVSGTVGRRSCSSNGARYWISTDRKPLACTRYRIVSGCNGRTCVKSRM